MVEVHLALQEAKTNMSIMRHCKNRMMRQSTHHRLVLRKQNMQENSPTSCVARRDNFGQRFRLF